MHILCFCRVVKTHFPWYCFTPSTSFYCVYSYFTGFLILKQSDDAHQKFVAHRQVRGTAVVWNPERCKAVVVWKPEGCKATCIRWICFVESHFQPQRRKAGYVQHHPCWTTLDIKTNCLTIKCFNAKFFVSPALYNEALIRGSRLFAPFMISSLASSCVGDYHFHILSSNFLLVLI